MKTTSNLRDDLALRAKAGAALRGQSLARYITEGIEQRLDAEEARPAFVDEWRDSLPQIRRELKSAGTPIPANDVWIAVLVRQYRLPIVSRNTHFDKDDRI